MMTQTTCRFEYSPFFSSGLLAPHTPRKNLNASSSWDDCSDAILPSQPSSPMSILDDSLMEIDMTQFIHDNSRRSATPTPQTTPMQSPQAVKAKTATPQQTLMAPRLRRRRSSLTQATSPMNAIRSPARTAGNALHLQRQLCTTAGPASPRARSGSVSSGEGMATSRYGNISVASDSTSLIGRLRSGSVGSPPAAPVAFRHRRGVRRLHTAPLSAPAAPPPTAPLPALPSEHQQLRPSNVNSPALGWSVLDAPTKTPSVPSTSSARARGLSVSSSTLGGEEHRIDEDMKEN
ncbi:hypothetical protein B0H34DRAFT_796487 [Crassisporium funariophilum]|nr:hypothetical protein B0H34DRAFT_796487 [Crassisporium funariophilum]